MKPFLLLLDGPMCFGKTTTAETVHERFPRTALLGMDRLKWSMSGFKRSSRNNAIIHNVIQAMTGAFLKNGVNVIVEQGFKEGLAEEFMRIGKQTRSRIIIVSLTALRTVLLARVRRPMKTRAAKARPAISWTRVLRNLRIMAARPPLGGSVIDTEHLTPMQTADAVTRVIKKRS